MRLKLFGVFTIEIMRVSMSDHSNFKGSESQIYPLKCNGMNLSELERYRYMELLIIMMKDHWFLIFSAISK